MSTCPKCGTDYESGVKICPKDGTVLEGGAAKDPRLGETLDGKYRLDAALGQGGMGSIYRATHLMLDKQVAVKLIKPELVTSPDLVRRFQREARAAGNLNHPNIAAAYDLGQTQDGTLYIAMELINGPSLKDVIRATGPLADDRIVRIMRQVSSALALAHRHNIIHRDLKPHNIMLATDGGHEVAKLLDFGIAKTFDDASTQLTATGFVLGTPQYMSPEQAAGRPIDGRSDLYSLGIILYEMLIGEVPFNDPSTPAVLVKHLTEPPSPPSVRRPDVHVSPVLEAVALRCLAKDPADRFQTADEFIAALPDSGTATRPIAADQDRTVLLSGAPGTASRPVTGVAASDPTVLAPSTSADPAHAPTATPLPAAAPPSVATPAIPTPAAPVPAPAPREATAAPAVAAAAAAVAPRAAVPPPPLSAPAPVAAHAHGASTPARTQDRSAANFFILAAVLLLVVGGVAYGAMRLLRGGGAASATAEAQTAALPAADMAAAGSVPADGAPVTESAPPAEPAETTSAASSGTAAGASASASPAASEPARAVAPPPAGARPPAPSSAPATTPPVTAQVAPAAATPALPANPSVLFRCDGPAQVCTALRGAMTDAFSRYTLRPTRDTAAADVMVDAEVTVVDEKSEQLYGTNFVTRTYSVEFTGDARGGDVVPMPAATTFSFDSSVGQRRVEDESRTMSIAVAERVRSWWRTHTGN